MFPLTIAKMIQLHEPFDLLGKYPVALPIKDDIYGGVKYALMILTPSTKVIQIIPARSPDVLKATIEIGELSPDFLQEFGIILIRYKTRTLYSTGVCFMQDRCTYEVYIDLSDLRISQEQLTYELAKIEGVSKVSIESLTTEVKPSRLSKKEVITSLKDEIFKRLRVIESLERKNLYDGRLIRSEAEKQQYLTYLKTSLEIVGRRYKELTGKSLEEVLKEINNII
ncbi:MAG: hypothetical protein ACFFB5_23185 [Promethearchaeota archaeon]